MVSQSIVSLLFHAHGRLCKDQSLWGFFQAAKDAAQLKKALLIGALEGY